MNNDQPQAEPPVIDSAKTDSPSSKVTVGHMTEPSSRPNKPSFKEVPPHKRLKWIFFKPEHVSRKKWLLVNFGLLILVILAIFGGYKLFTYLTKLPANNQAAVHKIKPLTEPSHLTGIQVKPELNQRPVTGIMIENSPDARPQSGLSDAGVVVEAIAEGGITRFLALYQEAQPQYIGPVRSLRPYYLDFANAFNAGVAHVGGSPVALSQIRNGKARDLDQFFNSQAYWRVTSRYAPHNVYTSFAKLDALNKAKGFKDSKFTSWPRKKDQPSTKPTATRVAINISSYYYNTAYKYDLKSNSYKRSEGGSTHTDEKSKKQVSPKVLIALVMPYSIAGDGYHSDYKDTGSGAVFVFQDGIVTKGKWHKRDHNSQITFTDASGKDIKLNAGQTWLTLVGNTNSVVYRP